MSRFAARGAKNALLYSTFQPNSFFKKNKVRNAGTAGTAVHPLSQKAFRRTTPVPPSQTLLHDVNRRFSIELSQSFFYFYF